MEKKMAEKKKLFVGINPEEKMVLESIAPYCSSTGGLPSNY